VALHSDLESLLQGRCMKFARENGVLAYKFVSPGRRGVPDSLFIFPGGEIAFVEFKNEAGGKLSALQIEEIRHLVGHGCCVSICSRYADFLRFIEKHLGPKKASKRCSSRCRNSWCGLPAGHEGLHIEAELSGYRWDDDGDE